MNKRLAVLLLRMAGAPDQPSKTYAEQLFTGAGKGTRNLVDYFDEMSHGRIDLGQSQVLDWIDYGHTNQDLTDEYNQAKTDKKKELLGAGKSEADAEKGAADHAHGFRREKIKEWGREAAKKAGYDITGFDVLVCLFNQPVDYFGSPGQVVLNWDASNGHQSFSVDLTGVSHEVGHGLGLEHSRQEGLDEEYGDPWDIMTAYDSIHNDDSGTQSPPGSPYYTFGPGLNAANMDLVGWLDNARTFSAGNSATFTLRPLHRHDLSGLLAARIQTGYEKIYVEFRTDDRWDIQIPSPCLLLHRRTVHPTDGNPCSELILAGKDADPPRADLRHGESYEAGDKNDPFGFYLRITAVRIDARRQEALVNVYLRDRRRIEPQGTIFGAVGQDGGGLIWTPGRGFKKVPPHSPLLNVLEALSDVETLREVGEGGGRELVEQLSMERLAKARDQIAGIIDARTRPRVPAPPTTLRSSEPPAAG